ncbi:MAG: RRXRR domain-containing protein, partial [Xenococcaceae cyanobacterium MO_234.B1]|nr:RRXRR domain-containing protein [Xenococcaceae cyanobacterium MO_234.B1]
NKQPLEPCSPTIAKKLLKAGKAAVFRQYPFTIILKKAVDKRELLPCQLKLDPGSVTTGIAILQDNKLIWAAELTYRGQQIKDDLESRRSLRRGRRGRKTKFNRTQQKLAKTHWLDAACVGDTPQIEIATNQPLLIKCCGHGKRQTIQVDSYGFPRLNKAGNKVRKSALIKQVKGFQTGDIVKAVVTKGKKIGSYLGKVAIRSSGSFNIKTVTQTVQGISYKYCKQVHRKDGYVYGF